MSFFSEDTLCSLKEYLRYRDIKIHKDNRVECDLTTPLFLNKINKRRLKSSAIQNMIRKLRKPTGIWRLHPHLLRATSASNLAKHGISIDIISKLLGHSGLDVVQKYVINSQEYIRSELKEVGLGCSA